jgi:hypothetical protein
MPVASRVVLEADERNRLEQQARACLFAANGLGKDAPLPGQNPSIIAAKPPAPPLRLIFWSTLKVLRVWSRRDWDSLFRWLTPFWTQFSPITFVNIGMYT